ncbi:MAG: RsbRD N-terminal domain-containing protein [Candidatus Magnetomorum sp.]|nr:RsbRD N-terminal domain-containing protein [Candidatus Magnetomorum sp.]
MTFIEHLDKNKQTIIEKWFNLIIETYPQDTTRFLKKDQDPFSNPVGNTTRNNITDLFDQLLTDDVDQAILLNYLDPILRIRAIQNFSASQAVGFLLEIKTIVRKMIGASKISFDDNDYFRFERRVDQMALYGFDVFMTCKEKIYDLKANEVRERSFQVLERANLIEKTPATAA